MKNPKLNLDLKTVLPQLRRVSAILTQHLVFIVLVVVLLAYVFTVWEIKQFANAEPSDSDQTTAIAKASIPRIDNNAIEQIQSLEQNNTQVQSLFDQARNNPFQE